MRKIAGSAALVLSLVLGNAAATPVTYDFTFTDTDNSTRGRIDATGTFVTGDAASDPGFFLLTSLTYTSLLVDGVLQTGSVVQTSFAAGAAYDPTMGAFVNHFVGGTYNDYGGGRTTNGKIGVYSNVLTSPSDFSQESLRGNYIYGEADSSPASTSFFGFDAILSIVAVPLAAPGTVPEPGSIALIGLGLVGLAMSRRSSKR